MSVEDHEVANRRLVAAGIGELNKVAAFVDAAIFYGAIEKVFSIAVGIRHFVVVVVVVIALHELHALVGDPDVVAVFGGIALPGMAHAAVVIDLYAVKAVERLADLVVGIGIDFP